MVKKLSVLLVWMYLCFPLYTWAQSLSEMQAKIQDPLNLPTPRFVIDIPDSTKSITIFFEDLTAVTPEKLARLKQIERIAFHFNNQAELDAEAALLINFPNLKYLTFIDRGRELENISQKIVLPESITTLKDIELVQLDLKLNFDYKALNNWLEGLPKLTHLFLMDVDGDFPISFSKLKGLIGLSINTSRSVTFPNWIAEMSGLEYLDFKMHRIDKGKVSFLEWGKALEHLQKLSNLKQLRLGSFEVENVDFDKYRFKQLEKLEISGLRFSNVVNFDRFLASNKRLKSLSIDVYGDFQLGDEITQLYKLKNLDLNSGRGKFDLNADLSHLKHVNSLKIYNIDLSERLNQFPPELTSLTLLSTKLKEIPSNISDLKKLKTLNLSGNLITELPRTSLPKVLENLNLMNNQFKHLQDEIGGVTRLKVLNLNYNPLESISEQISSLEALKVLEINSANLKSLPERIGELQSLQVLKLRSNYLEQLPESLGDIVGLKDLDVSYNHLRKLPNSFGNLQALEQFQANFNRIEALPENIGGWKSIKNIDLLNNNLQLLPLQIASLESLERLNVGSRIGANGKIEDFYRPNYKRGDTAFLRTVYSNDISNFPSDLSKWKSLKELIVDRNKKINQEVLLNAILQIPTQGYSLSLIDMGISELPKQGWDTFNVAKLNLNNNRISQIPKDIINAPYLNSFDFNGNLLPSSPINLNRSVQNKYDKYILFYEMGLISSRMLPKTDSMAIAWSTKAKNHIYRDQYEQAAAAIDKAFAINEEVALKHISLHQIGITRFTQGLYKESIAYLSKALQRDTAGRIRVMNFILPALETRASAYLKLDDLPSALEDYRVMAERFNSGMAGYAVLLRLDGQIDKANLFFEKAEKYYLSSIAANTRLDEYSEMERLSLLETYLINEDFSTAQSYADSLMKVIKAESSIHILNWLIATLKVAKGDLRDEAYHAALDDLSSFSNHNSSWSYNLASLWLDYTKLPAKRIEMMRLLLTSAQAL